MIGEVTILHHDAIPARKSYAWEWEAPGSRPFLTVGDIGLLHDALLRVKPSPPVGADIRIDGCKLTVTWWSDA